MLKKLNSFEQKVQKKSLRWMIYLKKTISFEKRFWINRKLMAGGF